MLLSTAFEVAAAENYQVSGGAVRRLIGMRDGRTRRSSIALAQGLTGLDAAAQHDLSWLRSGKRPARRAHNGVIRVADLFSGCGGLSLGTVEAARALGLGVDHVFASEINETYLDVYRTNFSPQHASSAPIQSLVDGELGGELTPAERRLKRKLGRLDLVAGGPPCQGHSDLNNHTRRDDPKNQLFARMARFAEVMRPTHVIIENVPGVRHDRSGVFDLTVEALERLGYAVDWCLARGERLGVAQRRKRAFLVASLRASLLPGSLDAWLESMVTPERAVSWACSDLLDIEQGRGLDQTTELTGVSKQRVEWLFENGEHDLPDEWRPDCHRTKTHTYKSVYGRLYWDRPAWTITTGFTVMGQGRFVHPLRPRVITPHEAARLQFFPDFFQFGEGRSRTEYAKMIGNAVPPKMAYAVALHLLR